MNLEERNVVLSIANLMEFENVDMKTIQEARKRYMDKVIELETLTMEVKGKLHMELERTFLDYIELIKNYYFILGKNSEEVIENYTLDIDPFARIRGEWQEEENKKADINNLSLGGQSEDL